MYGCESWTVEKAECWRIDAFELWCWRRFLRVPWTAKRSNRSIIKEISPEYSLDAETPIIWPPDAKKWVIVKDPDAEKDWSWEEKGMTEDEMVGWPTLWTWVWASSGSWWWSAKPGVLQFMGSQRVGRDWMTEPNWTELTWACYCLTEAML